MSGAARNRHGRAPLSQVGGSVKKPCAPESATGLFDSDGRAGPSGGGATAYERRSQAAKAQQA